MELRFLDEYVANGENGGRAYQILHPCASAVTARAQASRILAKRNIAQHLHEAREAYRDANRPMYNRVLEEWSKLAYADIGEVLDFSVTPPVLRKNIPASVRQAIQSITITPLEAPPAKKGKRKGKPRYKIDVKMHAKGNALDKISQHLGIYEPMPPLERLLSGLPEPYAIAIRQYLREYLLSQGRDPNLVPSGSQPVVHERTATTDPDAAWDVSGDGNAARPVASKIPRELLDAANGACVSSGRQEFCGSGEDVEPLFE